MAYLVAACVRYDYIVDLGKSYTMRTYSTPQGRFHTFEFIYDNEEVLKYFIIILACARSKIELKGYGRKLVTVKSNIRWALLAGLKVTVQQPQLWPDRIPRCVSIIGYCHCQRPRS